MIDSIEVVLQVFRAVERRDAQGLLALYHPDVEFYDPPSLPYGGSRIGFADAIVNASRWAETWDPVQTDAERRMNPRVVATKDDEVVVLYRQRAIDAAGRRFDDPVLGLYRVRDDKLQRAQMFHFDTAAILSFLDTAKRSSRPQP
jgi:ketosteroid isomerase-like protein